MASYHQKKKKKVMLQILTFNGDKQNKCQPIVGLVERNANNGLIPGNEYKVCQCVESATPEKMKKQIRCLQLHIKST